MSMFDLDGAPILGCKHDFAGRFAGRCRLYPLGTRDCKVSTQSGQRITKRAGQGNGPYRWTVDAICVFNTI